jgi:pimeloyl-ACP methyl ester carboxylesterase
MDEQTITIGGQRIAFWETQGPGRPVVFVHGNSSSARTWRQLMAGEFGQLYRCLALDLPGHGHSAPAEDPAAYSLPGYAAVLAQFLQATGAADAVIVGWSLGGHIAIEAAPGLPAAPGLVVFGTPPVGAASQLADAFHPHAALGIGMTADVTPDQAHAYAASFTAPGSRLPLDGFTEDILRTDGAARSGLSASIGEGRFGDQVAVVAALDVPIAILQGEDEQLVSLAYLTELSVARLWRGRVQLIAGAGHALHQEAPAKFADLLRQFVTDLSA